MFTVELWGLKGEERSLKLLYRTGGGSSLPHAKKVGVEVMDMFETTASRLAVRILDTSGAEAWRHFGDQRVIID